MCAHSLRNMTETLGQPEARRVDRQTGRWTRPEGRVEDARGHNGKEGEDDLDGSELGFHVGVCDQ